MSLEKYSVAWFVFVCIVCMFVCLIKNSSCCIKLLSKLVIHIWPKFC